VRDHGAAFGGEPDGHYIFPTFSLRGDAIAATAFFYELLSQAGESLSAILDALPRSVIRNEKIEWDGDLADFREEMLTLGQAFEHVEVLHERLFVMTTDHSKLSVRQSPFDGTLRIFAEGHDKDTVNRMIRDVKSRTKVER
jgi:phosphomannomutase